MAAVLVAEGEMIEEVFGGNDVAGGKHLRDARADAAHIHHLGFETGHRNDAKSSGLRSWVVGFLQETSLRRPNGNYICAREPSAEAPG